MNARAETANPESGWRLPALWLAPWAFYLSSVVVTLGASYFGGRGFGWLLPLTKNEVLGVLATVVILLWLSARIVVVVKSKSAALAFAVSLLELPFAFLVYLFWAVGMIGGPINPG
jgi:hypothetical protein